MNKALIIIDYVNDFVADTGSLSCGAHAQAVDAALAALVEQFAQSGSFIVTAADYHLPGDEYNPEAKLFPPHCLAGTPGCELFGQTARAVDKLPAAQLLRLPKTRYSAFAGTNLDLKLRERGITELYLTGVCTDICVLHTAVDAYNLGYKLHVYQRGVASFNAAGHEFALQHLKNTLGAEII